MEPTGANDDYEVDVADIKIRSDKLEMEFLEHLYDLQNNQEKKLDINLVFKSWMFTKLASIQLTLEEITARL